MPSDDPFGDVLAANEAYTRDFHDAGLKGQAARNLAVLTCIDSRIEPLTMLGLVPGDAKILRNAGARVTPDVLRSLVLATNLLGVERVMVIAHTDCAMVRGSEDDVHAAIAEAGGPDASGMTFLVTPDQETTVRNDVEALRSSPLLPDVHVGGFRYDVATGRLEQIV